MVSEEIGLNDAVAENGIDVFETDLGEFIIQLLNRPPFHIVGPAINIPVEEICDIFPGFKCCIHRRARRERRAAIFIKLEIRGTLKDAMGMIWPV